MRNVQLIQDFSFEFQAYKLMKRGVYVPLSSNLNVYATTWGLRGHNFNESEDIDLTCIYDKFTDTTAVYRGFGGIKIFLNCKHQGGGMECTPDQSKTDNKNLQVCKCTQEFYGFSKFVWTDCIYYSVFLHYA